MLVRNIIVFLIFISLVFLVILLLKDKLTLNTSSHLTNKGIVDYDDYVMTKNEYLMYIFSAAILLFIIGYIFYQHFYTALLLTPFSVIYPKYKRKEIIQNRRLQLLNQFKEAMYGISSSLSVGKSLETAIKDSLGDLEIMYDDPDTLIIRELTIVVRRLELNDTVEEAIADLAARSKLDDIRNFSEVLNTCKRAGGNLIEVMGTTAKTIGEKIYFTQELNLMVAQRKFDQKILSITPFALIITLSIVAKDYMEPVFTTIIGRIVMTVAFVMIVAALIISKRIMNIEV
ncbi:type II secretion system F family protein [Alkaliphilus peptidifermentans]|uniref:Tight adherence protein B n=1 Tax=Alkaliphilus peptidifermentans DSM 18978 TaxID=1120976 RepID=A0A1G5J9Y5_9FIRM|nr:pilus assembly protein TadB [Alkaliphilus peptidifermentans]SCY84508.1 tight adherence protein B [Alkaliphilus peptidifermentans DSM 18978]